MTEIRFKQRAAQRSEIANPFVDGGVQTPAGLDPRNATSSGCVPTNDGANS